MRGTSGTTDSQESSSSVVCANLGRTDQVGAVLADGADLAEHSMGGRSVQLNITNTGLTKRPAATVCSSSSFPLGEMKALLWECHQGPLNLSRSIRPAFFVRAHTDAVGLRKFWSIDYNVDNGTGSPQPYRLAYSNGRRRVFFLDISRVAQFLLRSSLAACWVSGAHRCAHIACRRSSCSVIFKCKWSPWVGCRISPQTIRRRTDSLYSGESAT